LFLLPLALAADAPTVKLPTEIKARPGRLLQIRAETDGKIVRWFCPSTDADLLPYPGADKIAIFCSPVPGKYFVYAYTAAADIPSEPAVCCVIVDGPTPIPPPVPPTDPLSQALQAAYNSEPAANKASQKDLLEGLYRAAASAAADQSLKTAGDLYSTLVAAREKLMPDEALRSTRLAIANYLDTRLPRSPAAPLTPDIRTQATTEFVKIANTLGGLK
jgi:hypothetical protein